MTTFVLLIVGVSTVSTGFFSKETNVETGLGVYATYAECLEHKEKTLEKNKGKYDQVQGWCSEQKLGGSK